MGIILDSSVVISAERHRETIAQLLRNIVTVTGDQEVGLSSVGLTELIHGIYRANTPERRKTRELFINELISFVNVYPFTRETALVAGKIDGEQQAKGIVIPFADLLIGATALSLDYSVVTVNPRDFSWIPGLSVTQLANRDLTQNG